MVEKLLPDAEWYKAKLIAAENELNTYKNALSDVTYSGSLGEAKQYAGTALEAYDPFAPK